ncbi:MAG: UDP-2,3-diacylglucosamine pyrophosphatase LpxH [Patiriisocius sp.]
MARFKSINRSLDRCYRTGLKIDVEARDLKWIIFSDHHRGRRDGADDFLICEDTYVAALNHYHQSEFSLCLLGDVEEFWENPFITVMVKYADVLQLEKKFYDADRLYRIWGNHDDAWKFADTIRKHLGWLFPKIAVYESLVLNVNDEDESGEIFLVHGHQGSAESDRFSAISKFFVKYIWRNVQRLFKIPLSTPANNLKLKSQHDKAMYNWAFKNEKTLICGHTHQPVFLSLTHEEKILREIANIRESMEEDIRDEKIKEQLDLLMKKVETQLANNPNADHTEKKKPCYFNTGCCSFSDGDITGIELENKMIRLVKWDKEKKERIVLEEVSLNTVFEET